MRALFLVFCFFASPAWADTIFANPATAGYSKYGTLCASVTGTPQVPATYDDTGVGNALSAATVASDKTVKFSSNYTPATRVTIPDNVTIYSENGSTITSSSTTTGFLLGNNSRITGFNFTGSRPIALQTTTGLTIASTINCNTFTDITSQAIYDGSTADNTVHTALTVQRNAFVRNAYAMWFTRISNFVVTDNYLADSTNRNIEYHGSRSSKFLRNSISSGVTGIIGLADSQYNRFVATFIDNEVADNYFYNISEEATSYDGNGDSAANVSLIDQFTVNATPTSGTFNSSPRVNVNCVSCSGLIANGTAGYALTWVTGANAGKSFITASVATLSAGTTIFLQLRTTPLANEPVITAAEFAAIAASDVVVLGHQAIGNRILRNWIDNSQTGILFYGMGYQNIIAGNIITRMKGTGPVYTRHGIGIRSLCGIVASSKFANPNTVTSTQCGPSDYNSVYNNTTDDEIAVGGKSFATSGNTVGINVVENNQIYNNVGDIVSEAYWDNANSGYYGSVLNSAALINHNNALTSAGVLQPLAPSSPDALCLKPDSALLGAGTYIGDYVLGYAGEHFTNPPAIGARGLCRARLPTAVRVGR